MHRPVTRRIALFVSLACATTASAQKVRSTSFVDDCARNNGRDEVVCETRAVTLSPSASLKVDGRQNGGITVHAWDNAQFQIVAMVQARGETQAQAQSIARAINITASNGEIRSEGPDTEDHQSWSVSFEVWAPRRTTLALVAMNGGISVDGMNSQMTLETMNGGLTLTDIQGDVKGTTMNGGITADLNGDRWQGGGLDLKTMNGGIKLSLPASYSAQLETSTVNGGLDLGIPVSVDRLGRQNRQMTAMLGSGGATIRAVTTNGGVSITRK